LRQWETIVILASGPSLTVEDCERVRVAQAEGRCKVIAINTTYQRAPWADVLFARDLNWWKGYAKRAGSTWPGFTGERWTTDQLAAERFGVTYVRGIHTPGLSERPGVVHLGDDSGYAAIGLAVMFGARRVVLLGYDMQRTDGLAHWHGEHEHGMRSALKFRRWLLAYGRLAKGLRRAGIEVVNCTRQTALHVFPRAVIDRAL
jgi:hypothetical protein